MKLLPGEVTKNSPSSYETIWKSFDTVSLKEFAVFYDKTAEEAEGPLTRLEQQKKVRRLVSKAGSLWKLAN